MFTVRGFADPDGYAKRHAYELVMSVFLMGNGRARAFAAHGEISRATMQQLSERLQALGVDTLLVDRHGVEQMWKAAHGKPYKKETP